MLFSALTEKDIETINTYVSLYGQYDNGDLPSKGLAPLKYRLRFWEKNKTDLFKLLGNQLIVKFPVSQITDIDEINKKLNEARYENGIYRNLLAALRRHPQLQDWTIQDTIYLILSPEVLTKNQLSFGRTLHLPDDTILKYQSGAKPFRILHKIVKSINDQEINELYEQFRLLHSQILNDTKLTGNLCLSIHPMDYFTMSDNDYDWCSCMNWRDDGEYHLGTVECLNSQNILVAYLEGSKPMKIDYTGNISWEGNKKWRTLITVTPDFISTIKGYPYQHEGLATFALNKVKELAEANCGITFHDEMFASEYSRLDINDYYSITPQFDKMYNDYGAATSYWYVTPNVIKDANDCFEHKHFGNHYVYLNDEINCMCCGKENEIDDDAVFCYDCNNDNYCTCELCGERIHADEERYEVSNLVLCQYCFENETAYNVFTDESELSQECDNLYIRNDETGSCESGITVPVRYLGGPLKHFSELNGLFTVPTFHTTSAGWSFVNKTEITPEGWKVMDPELWSCFLNISEDKIAS